MRRTTRVLAWILVGLVAVAPLSAAVYTVTLNNGTTFETRYEPRDAPWDANKTVFLDEWGNLISLAKDEVAEVVSDFESKGYGAMLDDTTMSLGWAPNDAIDPASPEGQQAAAVAAAAAQQSAGQESITYDQFVEPNQTQGMPAQWVGYPVNLEQGTQSAPPPQENLQ
jgi:hypothetical protein